MQAPVIAFDSTLSQWRLTLRSIPLDNSSGHVTATSFPLAVPARFVPLCSTQAPCSSSLCVPADLRALLRCRVRCKLADVSARALPDTPMGLNHQGSARQRGHPRSGPTPARLHCSQVNSSCWPWSGPDAPFLRASEDARVPGAFAPARSFGMRPSLWTPPTVPERCQRRPVGLVARGRGPSQLARWVLLSGPKTVAQCPGWVPLARPEGRSCLPGGFRRCVPKLAAASPVDAALRRRSAAPLCPVGSARPARRLVLLLPWTSLYGTEVPLCSVRVGAARPPRGVATQCPRDPPLRAEARRRFSRGLGVPVPKFRSALPEWDPPPRTEVHCCFSRGGLDA